MSSACFVRKMGFGLGGFVWFWFWVFFICLERALCLSYSVQMLLDFVGVLDWVAGLVAQEF